jgi:diadenosine tetraphosphatase ApaH/serine/threonine PP2A family protein phosphatase
MLRGKEEFVQRIARGDVGKDELVGICRDVADLLIREPALLTLPLQTAVVGDIHGQFYDLLELFEACEGRCERYLFLGDYVDRGANSLETLTLLLWLKKTFPEKIYLLRGNHESRKISFVYGFYEECLRKYGDLFMWNLFCDLFDCLPLAAVLGEKIFAVHGGLGPSIRKIGEILGIDRVGEIPMEGPIAEFVWSDPLEDEIPGEEEYSKSARGAGFLFSKRQTEEFLARNGLEAIVRSHQLVDEGYREMHGGRLITIWSAPNYCYRCGNKGCVLVLGKEGEREYIEVKQAQMQRRQIQEIPEYFL